jgi:hypothetical protein
LLRRLHPHQLRGRDRFLEDPNAPGFWKATDGVRGVWYRWRNRKVFLGLCQIRVLQHGLDAERLRYITRRCAELTALTALLLLLAPFQQLNPVDRLGRRAFKIYAQIADRTHTFFSDDNVPVCSLRLATLL